MSFRLYTFLILLVAGSTDALYAQMRLSVPEPFAEDQGYARLWMANDMFYLPIRSDQYYSAGMGVQYVRYRSDRSYRSWGVRQEIYTPKEIESVEVTHNDRPFAGTLLFNFGWGSFGEGGIDFATELTVGVLGRHAGGGKVQNKVHSIVSYADEVPGWVNEVEPDLALNYRMRFGKDWLPASGTNVITYGRAEFGTLFTNAAFGGELGGDYPLFAGKLRLTASVAYEVRAVAYNATLTGGLLNRDARYRTAIDPEPVVAQSRVSFDLRYRGLALECTAVRNGAEFIGGEQHFYATCGARIHW